MSFIHNSTLAGASGNQGPYQIEQSLRFNQPDSYTFRRTPGANSTSQRRFTFSVWSKRALVAAGTANNVGRQSIFYTGLANGSGNLFGLEWRDDEVACIFNGAGSIYPQTVAKFRDASAWYHIVVAVDTDQATDTDRCKVYVNGVQQTLTGTLPTSGFLVTNGTTSVHSVGELGVLRSNQYLAEAYYINDQQLAPTDFAETNNYGVWIPKPYEGTFTGTNSYYLKFDPAAANGIGHDDSGNGNNFTTTNFSTTGTGTDVMSDTPTKNWCTLNPLVRNNNLSDGNLVYNTATAETAYSTFGVSSGRWYCEVTCNNANTWFGIGTDPFLRLNAGANNQVLVGTGGGTVHSQNSTNTFDAGDTWTTNDVIGIALDADNGGCIFYKNNTRILEWDSFTVDGPYFFGFDRENPTPTTTHTVNFGQHDFAHTPPTGYKALNTSNLPVPTIKDGSKYFNTVLYTGNATGRTVTGVGFQADFLWNKLRDTGAQNHLLYDTVRGIGVNGNYVRLRSDTATAEEDPGTANQDLTAFTSDGFTIGTQAALNGNNQQYVTWLWKAGGGSGSSIAAGSIDGTNPTIASTVSANPSAGFSIVSYTASGTDNDTVAHGLGVAPSFHIVKSRDGARDWLAYTREIDGSLDFLRLNTTAAAANSSANAPTSTVFSIFGADINTAGEDCIAYCFAEVEGYSKFGIYTGNGLADGPFVYCGFKPAFVLIKSSSAAATNWAILDNTRNPINIINDQLFANLSNTEFVNFAFGDFVSNGFKIRDNASGLQANYNTNNATYVFAAFAEHPIGGLNVSPATAR